MFIQKANISLIKMLEISSLQLNFYDCTASRNDLDNPSTFS